MHFAAYVVALFFFEVQSQQQCSESLGTCSGSRASLMQVKSFSQKMQTSSTGRGTSKHAETLAGFQKYTSELVDKYLADPDKQQSGLGQEVIDAINIIKDYLQSLYKDLLLFHYQDGNASEWCAGSAQRCGLQLPDETELIRLDDLVAELQNEHLSCQKRLEEECSPKTPPQPVCPDYHSSRDSSPFPVCGKNGYLKREYREVPFDVSGQDTDASMKLKHFESCLDDMKPWLDPLYNAYIACDESESSSTTEPEGCGSEQGDFEEAYCQRLTFRDRRCDVFDTCIGHAKNHCEEGAEGEPGVCPQIEANWKARQSDNETAERISCLLDVLTSKDADKAEGLQACHNRDFTEVNAFWEIDCFIKEQPAGEVCRRDLDSCGEEFEAEYYPDFGHARLPDEATCCSDGKGKCRETCSFKCSN